jgi:hypothetical protein
MQAQALADFAEAQLGMLDVKTEQHIDGFLHGGRACWCAYLAKGVVPHI